MALDNNLAHTIHEHAPSYTPQKNSENQGKKTLQKKNRYFLEKTIAVSMAIIVFLLTFAVVSFEIKIASANRSLQDTNREVATETVINRNLEQEVQELSRYDRVYAIAKANGLEMNEENVRNVSK